MIDTLNRIGLKYNTDKAFLHNFCNFYEQNLNKEVYKLWEIGVLDGASLQMWSEYYPNAEITGFDIEDKSSLKLCNNVNVKLLDQGNKEQLERLANENKDIDIIIDDGSHIINHQIMTFEILFNSLKSGGQYIIEDLHTSTDLHINGNYNYKNKKGTLQYLLDISMAIIPKDYPGQIKTQTIISNIADIKIFTNIRTNGRSITSIITKK